MKRLMPFCLAFLISSGLGAGNEGALAHTIEIGTYGKDEVRVECTIEDGLCTVVIHNDGEVEEYTFSYEGTEKLNEFIESTVGGDDFALNLKVGEGHTYVMELDDETGDDRDQDKKAHRKKIKIKRFGPDLHQGEQTWFGVHIQPLTEQLREFFKVENSAGILVSEVVEDSPAETAGLKAGDVIVKVEREKIEETDDLVEVIRESDAGDEVTVKIIRDGKRETLSATLESRETDRGPPVAWFHGDDDEDIEVFRMPKLSVPGMEEYKSLRDEIDALREELKELKKEIEKEDANPN